MVTMLSRIRHISLAPLLALAAHLGAASARAESLSDAVSEAYGDNPAILADRARQRALDEDAVQARAGLGPSLNLQANISRAENTNRLITPPFAESSAASLVITQPLWTGGRLAHTVDAADRSVEAGAAGLRQTDETLILSVVTAYMDVRRDRENLETARESLQLLQKELEENQARLAVGDIGRTDVAQTEARVAGARTQTANAQAQLDNSRANYAALVGHLPEALDDPPDIAARMPPSLEAAFRLAESGNPTLQQAKATEAASAAKLAATRDQVKPSLSLQASLGVATGQYGVGNPFVDYSRNITASAVVNMPIYTGGLISSEIRAASENHEADRFAIADARRRTDLAAAQAWNAWQAARTALEASMQQVASTRVAFEGAREESRVGLRSNLDVLIDEQDFAAARQALAAAQHDVFVTETALLAAMGQLDVTVFDPKATPYDPRRHLQRETRTFPATPLAPWGPAVEAIDRIP